MFLEPMAPNMNETKVGSEIPEEIIHEILLRLPGKCLLKFRRVCKSWRDLIGSQKFIDLHLNHPSQNTRRRSSSSCLVLKRYKHTGTTLSFHSRGSLRTIPLDIPELPQRIGELCGPCNGIFLVGESYNESVFAGIIHAKRGRIYLCNPTTRECRELPDRPCEINYKSLPPFRGLLPEFNRSLGLGFDPTTNEYKVVALECKIMDIKREYQMHIFYLSSNSWRKAGKVFPVIHNIDGASTLDLNGLMVAMYPHPFASVKKGSGNLFFNGHLHWIMMVMNWRQIGIILCFDVSNETMRYFSLSSDLQGSVLPTQKKEAEALLVIDDSLALGVSGYEPGTGNRWFEIWVMKEYGNIESWVKIYRFGSFTNGYISPCPIAFSFWNDDMLLFQYWDDCSFYYFDLRVEDPQPRRHEIRSDLALGCYTVAIVMDKDSLVSLTNLNKLT